MDIYQCIRPLYYALKVCGLTPFELIDQGNKDNKIKRLRISIIGILYNIFICISIIISILFVLISNSSYYIQSGYSPNIVTIVILYFSLSSSALSAVIGCIIKRKRLLILLENILKFETQFYSHNSKMIQFNRFIKFELLITYISITLLSIYDIWLWGIYYHSELNFLHYVFIHIIMSTLTIEYTNIIYLNYDKFKLINLSLVKDIKKYCQLIDITSYNISINNNYQELRKMNLISKLRNFRRLHYSLHNISDEVNKVFGIQILFFVLSFFIGITRNIYYSLYFVLNE
ncbi:hypothetical protein L9F63_009833, partial [Diploptera punctata]